MPNDNESTEKLLALLTERVSSLERIVALQHAENGQLYAAVRGHQEIFDRMVAQASAAPVN